jgi:hypothetical protein
MSPSDRSGPGSQSGSANEPTVVMPTVRPPGRAERTGATGRVPTSGSSASSQPAAGPVGSGPAAPAASRAGVEGAPGPRKARKARLVLARVDPWSVMKLSFLLAVALAIIAVTAVFVLWTVLDRIGAFGAVSRVIADITEGESGGAFDLTQYVGLSRVLGATAILACVNIVLMTAVATLSAFLYNIASSLVGGLHVTLTEET